MSLLRDFLKQRKEVKDNISFWRRHKWRVFKNDEDITGEYLADQENLVGRLSKLIRGLTYR
jgi:hypothetical protein